MELHRYDFEEVDGNLVRVRRDEIYVWTPVNTETGEVELDDIRRFDDELEPLTDGREWRRFTMTLTKNAPAITLYRRPEAED